MVAASVMLVVGGVSTHALGQQMSTEFTISAHDGVESLGGIAYNQFREEYLVVWDLTVGTFPLQSEIWACMASADGVLGTPFIVASGFDSGEGDDRRRVHPAVAFDSFANRYLVVYLYDFYGNATDWDLRGRLIPDYGPDPNLTEFVICDLPSDQLNPAVAAGEIHQQFLVVWEDQPDGSPRPPSFIYGTRIHAADGTSEGGKVISSGDYERSNPDLAYHYGRDEFLVTWDRLHAPSTNRHVIEGLRIGPSGEILMSQQQIMGHIFEDVTNPAAVISRVSDDYLVVYQTEILPEKTDKCIELGKFFAAELSTSCSLTLNIGSNPWKKLYHVSPDVSSCDRWGVNHLVVWQERYYNATGPHGVRGRFVSPNCSKRTSFEIMAPGPSASRFNPKVCGGDRNHLVVWEHERDGAPSHQDIHGRLVQFTPTVAPIIVNLL
jgi:hypothetical protein